MILALACAVDPAAFADIPAEAVDTPDPAIDEPVLAAMEAGEIVGLGVGVVEGGELSYLRGYGWQRWDDTPFSARTTKVRWASLSKSVTASVAVMAGIDLDADIRTWLPTYAPPDNGAGALISLRMLLGHLAGTRHYGDDPLDDGSPPAAKTDDPAVNTGMEWALRYWVQDPLVNEPGADFHYSSYGYNLAGVVIEHALGRALDDVARERIFDPLEMDSTGPDRGWVDDPARAEGYGRDLFGGVVPVYDHDVSWKLAAGGWQSTTEDLTRWCAGFLGDTVLTAAQKDTLWTEQTTTTGEGTGYGMGFFVGGDRVSHSGGNERSTILVRAWPEDQRCIVLMSNSNYAAVGALMDEL